ncbi:DUF1350 family protein [Microseira sp. BLCC-F43]|jgi:hypothetical protein|uniref:DUF1350 family protein n=1 Tax=Microseira sp. BLCC-F43 TaxID=3153602 RepID=UPI0035BA1782
MDWQEISGNWVLIPPRPLAIIHFLGGAFVATAPQVTYRMLLEDLGRKGYLVVATPFVNTLDHAAIARSVLYSFEDTLETLQANSLLRRRYLPIYGIGHSMGCKLHLLIGSLFSVERAGNILISFNNYAARDAIPLVDQFNLSTTFNVEFTPSPQKTNAIVAQRYQVRRNLLIQFKNDTIDQTDALTALLQNRFGDMVSAVRLPGNHLTPLGQDVRWQVGQVFTPWDALGQWFKQEVYRELNQLQSAIFRWIDPFSPR